MREMQWNWGRKAAVCLAALILFTVVFNGEETVWAAKKSKVYLSETAITMNPATKKKLKLNGASSKIKWSSSSKKTATVDDKGTVTARAKGTAKITATYKKKKYRCKVTVVYGTYTTSDGMRYQDVSGSFGRSGRWYKKGIDGGNYYFTSTEGSSIYFKVTGSQHVDINFVSNLAVATPYFSYSVDGGSMKRQSVSKNRISLGNTKTHYVRLVIDAMSESENRWGGEAGIGIRSITPASANGAIAAIRPQNAVIAFYGDSITQGIRALNKKLTPAGTSATHSYAWHCAAQLDLVPYFAGYGGSGIIQPGSFNNCINAIEAYSMFRKADSYEADVIIVEHGTNDIYTYGEAFINEYKRVLQLLHKKHPNAYIMPMIPFTQLHASEIRQAASSFKWCTVVETASWHITYTDGLHPNKAGAKTAGLSLAQKVALKRKVSLY